MLRKKSNQEGYTNAVLCENTNSEKKKELTYFAKDNFWTINFPTTASSKFLSNFFSSQNAFVIELLEKKKILLGKTALDEFACGGTGLHAATGPIFNPYNSACIVGGSSSGSA